jgi:hypothetical protein
MKRSIVVALAAAGFLLAGCGPSSSPSSNGGSGTGSTGSGTPTGSTSTPASTAQGIGTPLFPVALGDTWVYTDTVSSEHGTSTNKVTAVTPVPGGHRVTLGISTNIAGVATKPTSVIYIFHSDGSITVPFQQVGSSSVTIKSGAIIWPSQAQLNSGQSHSSKLVVSIHSAAISTTVNANIVVKGEGTQSVTVPAGTYSATVVNEAISEKVEGITVNIVVKTWLAPGVGPVKSEVLSSALGSTKPEAIDVLKSFTKG